MNPIDLKKGVKAISSLEVAEMIQKQHAHLMRDKGILFTALVTAEEVNLEKGLVTQE